MNVVIVNSDKDVFRLLIGYIGYMVVIVDSYRSASPATEFCVRYLNVVAPADIDALFGCVMIIEVGTKDTNSQDARAIRVVRIGKISGAARFDKCRGVRPRLALWAFI